MDKYNILKDLVKFNTIKDKENKEILDYIEKYLKELGFRTEYRTKDLVMSIGSDPKIGFLGHTDTVEYIDDFKNPFDLRIQDGNMYGLGSCDMKGGIAAILYVMSKLDFTKLKNGIKLYFTYDEEIAFGGVNELVSNNERFPEYMIFGEPTNNEVLNGSKGLIEYEICFKGIKAHSSTPNKGISANLNSVNFLYELNNFYERIIKYDKNDAFEIPYTTMNIGIINGGSAKNSVSAYCKVELDFRIIDNKHIEVINNKIDELCNKYNAEFDRTTCIKTFVNDINFIKKVKTSNFITEASLIDKSKKIILGPGPITAHEVNEYISINSFDKLVEQYTDLIHNVYKQ